MPTYEFPDVRLTDVTGLGSSDKRTRRDRAGQGVRAVWRLDEATSGRRKAFHSTGVRDRIIGTGQR